MKWMLIVVVMGSAPVKTDLLFNSLQECLDAEEGVRQEYADALNRWYEWAISNPDVSHYPDSREFMTKQITGNLGTCVPHAALPEISN